MSFDLERLPALPPFLPGETVAETSIFGAAYSPDGELLDADPISGATLMADWEQRKDFCYKTDLVIQQLPIQVSTVWLGMSHNSFDGPPMIWETMMVSQEQWSDFQARYCTQAAALHGHKTVVGWLGKAGATVRESNIDVPGYKAVES